MHMHTQNYFDGVKSFDGVKAGIKKHQGMLTENNLQYKKNSIKAGKKNHLALLLLLKFLRF